jgi:hypothetical protein
MRPKSNHIAAFALDLKSAYEGEQMIFGLLSLANLTQFSIHLEVLKTSYGLRYTHQIRMSEWESDRYFLKIPDKVHQTLGTTAMNSGSLSLMVMVMAQSSVT